MPVIPALEETIGEMRIEWAKTDDQQYVKAALTTEVGDSIRKPAEGTVYQNEEAQKLLFTCLVASRNLALRDKEQGLYDAERVLLGKLVHFIAGYPDHVLSEASRQLDELEAANGPLQIGPTGLAKIQELITKVDTAACPRILA